MNVETDFLGHWKTQLLAGLLESDNAGLVRRLVELEKEGVL